MKLAKKNATKRSDAKTESLGHSPKAVVIGGSAGGIDALFEILPNLPKNFGLPVIVVLHLPVNQPSFLSEIFRPQTELMVKDAEDGEVISPGTIYFAPAGAHLQVSPDHKFRLSNDEPVLLSRPSIDVLFESAGKVFGNQLIGIVLTGGSRDGSIGLKRIQEAGGVVVVQDPLTAKVTALPEAACRLVAVPKEQVLDLPRISQFLIEQDSKQETVANLGTLLEPSGHQEVELVKILLVDDLQSNLSVLEGLLRQDKFEIFCAKSGTAALELMISHDFALALIDVQMPVMSGFQLAEIMRGTKRGYDMPIIFVSANARNQSFSFKGSDSGAVDFLTKPLDISAVKGKVNIFVELYLQKQKLKLKLEAVRQNQKIQEALFLRLMKTHGELEDSVDFAEKAKRVAEQGSEAKSEFLANMSHEIRTPLGAILGFTELLRDQNLTEEKRTLYLDTLSRNGESLSVIINDILDLSKVEAGQLKIEFIETRVRQIISDAIFLLTAQAQSKGLTLNFQVDKLVPKTICTDPTRLKQILLNLIGNAIKFTEVGSVQLRCTMIGQKPDSEAISIEVIDTGIGIPSLQRQKVFEKFVQADETMARRFGGTGLGLALSRELARALGGDIFLDESNPGKGSSFRLTLATKPLEISDAPHSLEEAESKVANEAISGKKILDGLKVLIVDDSPDNQYLISHYLKLAGSDVVAVDGGQEALALDFCNDFDVILMDINMAGMDGYMVTQRMRAAGCAKPIVALTAHAMSEVRQKCLDAGCSDYLAKPIQFPVLISMLSGLSQQIRSPGLGD